MLLPHRVDRLMVVNFQASKDYSLIQKFIINEMKDWVGDDMKKAGQHVLAGLFLADEAA